MIQEYLPVVFQILAALGIGVGAIVLSHVLGRRRRHDPEKDMPYECGKDPITPSVPSFSVKFYLVAMLFILFDIELIFLYAWSVNYTEMVQGPLGMRLFCTMLAFAIIVGVGHLYACKQGVFDWYTPPRPK